MKVLILYAHPRPSASIAQNKLLAAINTIPDVTIHDLYAAYPDLLINRQHEQKLLLAHDIVVFQHPFYWYSAPAIIKEWLDIVLDFGWAYGPGGNRLHGKYMMNAITTGGSQDAYAPGGRNRFSIEQLLAPFNQTAYLCGMGWLSPLAIYEARKLEQDAFNQQVAKWKKQLEGWGERKNRSPDASFPLL